MNSRVFVVQIAQKLSQDRSRFEPKFDVRRAELYGRIVELLSPTARPFSSEHCVGVLREKLADFSDDDYLLLIGNPALIGFATAIASAANNGRVKLLQWSGAHKKYLPIEADLSPGQIGDASPGVRGARVLCEIRADDDYSNDEDLDEE